MISRPMTKTSSFLLGLGAGCLTVLLLAGAVFLFAFESH
jgi:hypothetical protein